MVVCGSDLESQTSQTHRHVTAIASLPLGVHSHAIQHAFPCYSWYLFGPYPSVGCSRGAQHQASHEVSWLIQCVLSDPPTRVPVITRSFLPLTHVENPDAQRMKDLCDAFEREPSTATLGWDCSKPEDYCKWSGVICYGRENDQPVQSMYDVTECKSPAPPYAAAHSTTRI